MSFDDPMDREEAFKIARASQPAVHTDCWRALKALLKCADEREKSLMAIGPKYLASQKESRAALETAKCAWETTRLSDKSRAKVEKQLAATKIPFLCRIGWHSFEVLSHKLLSAPRNTVEFEYKCRRPACGQPKFEIYDR